MADYWVTKTIVEKIRIGVSGENTPEGAIAQAMKSRQLAYGEVTVSYEAEMVYPDKRLKFISDEHSSDSH